MGTRRVGPSVPALDAWPPARKRRFSLPLEKYFGEIRPQRFGIGRLTAEADITVGADHIQTGTPRSIVVVYLAPRIQKYFAFAYTVLGELVGDDQVRFDAVWVGVNGCIGQGLQSSMRFPGRVRTCEQHQGVHGATYPLEEPNGFASGMKHEPAIGGAVSRARPGAEIMPSKNTG